MRTNLVKYIFFCKMSKVQESLPVAGSPVLALAAHAQWRRCHVTRLPCAGCVEWPWYRAESEDFDAVEYRWAVQPHHRSCSSDLQWHRQGQLLGRVLTSHSRHVVDRFNRLHLYEQPNSTHEQIWAGLTIRGGGHHNVRRGPFSHTRSQYFLWACTFFSESALFFPQKVDDLF